MKFRIEKASDTEVRDANYIDINTLDELMDWIKNQREEVIISRFLIDDDDDDAEYDYRIIIYDDYIE